MTEWLVGRLYDQQGRWSELAQALRREADTTTDQTRRSLLLYQLGRVEAERLENRAAAIEVLERAAADSEDDPLVLSYLARQLEADERFDALTPVLRRLVVQTDQASERQVLLHRIGQLVERTGDEMLPLPASRAPSLNSET